MNQDAPNAANNEISAPPRTTIETFYRAFSGEPDLLDQVVTADWQDIPLAPGQAPGPEGIKPMILAFKQAFPDLAITVHEFIQDAGRIGVRAEITGTHTGDWFGVAATSRAISIRCTSSIELKMVD